MKKILLTLLLLFVTGSSYAIDDLKPVGISNYAVIEISKDYAPLRTAPNEDAKRYTHLRKGVIVYADKMNENYYRVDLDLKDYYWLNKKYADVQAVIPVKRIPTISKIEFEKNKKYNYAVFPTDTQTSYKTLETPSGLEFTLYDVMFNPNEVKCKGSGKFVVQFNDNNSITLKHKTPFLVGYDVDRTEEGLALKVKKPLKISKRKPLKKVVVALDAGHGGGEPGVVAYGFSEKDVNLEITKKLEKEFKRRGAKVVMTRDNDKNVELEERVQIAKEKHADFFISIHQNSLANRADIDKKHGVGVYYYNGEAKMMAESIQSELVKDTGFRDDGVNYASFAVVRPTEPVGVLVECGYLIHPEEVKKLTDKDFQKVIAKSITKGMENYLKRL